MEIYNAIGRTESLNEENKQDGKLVTEKQYKL